jgi:hypothetical protein
MKFAICNEVFENWPFDRVCRYVVSVGYEGLELAPFTLASNINELTADRRAELRQQAADAGVEIIGLHLTSPDPEVRARTADYLVALARATRDLGGTLMVFGSPRQRSLQDGVTWDQAFDRAAEVFRAAMPGVAESGVRLCMEPLDPGETNFINTCAEGLRLVDAVAHPDFVLHPPVVSGAAQRRKDGDEVDLAEASVLTWMRCPCGIRNRPARTHSRWHGDSLGASQKAPMFTPNVRLRPRAGANWKCSRKYLSVRFSTATTTPARSRPRVRFTPSATR